MQNLLILKLLQWPQDQGPCSINYNKFTFCSSVTFCLNVELTFYLQKIPLYLCLGSGSNHRTWVLILVQYSFKSLINPIAGWDALHPDHWPWNIRIRSRRNVSSFRPRPRDERLHPELVRRSIHRKSLESRFDGLAGLHSSQRHRVLDQNDPRVSQKGKK